MTQPAPFTYRVRVQYIDTDQGGVVHHAAYLRFMEQARVEMLRAHGVDYRRFEVETRRGLPVAGLEVRYHTPGYFDDEFEVLTEVGLINRAKLRFDYRVMRGDTLVVSAQITCACVDLERKRLCSMDPKIREAFG